MRCQSEQHLKPSNQQAAGSGQGSKWQQRTIEKLHDILRRIRNQNISEWGKLQSRCKHASSGWVVLEQSKTWNRQASLPKVTLITKQFCSIAVCMWHPFAPFKFRTHPNEQQILPNQEHATAWKKQQIYKFKCLDEKERGFCVLSKPRLVHTGQIGVDLAFWGLCSKPQDAQMEFWIHLYAV